MQNQSRKRIAIIGAGPIGLEAAVYGKLLGYEVSVFERGKVGEHLRSWGHVSMFSPVELNISPLILSVLEKQDPTWQPPNSERLLTGEQYVQQILAPLANSELLAGVIAENTEVITVGRQATIKPNQRQPTPFRILTRNAGGEESVALADYVIDASGVFTQPNFLGDGGIPAIGELENRQRIEYHLPDVAGQEKEKYLGKHTLVVGSGYSAATTITALARLAAQDRNTKITWLTRKASEATQGPITRIKNDRLKSRDQLAQQANELAQQTGQAAIVKHIAGETISAVRWHEQDQHFSVELCGGQSKTIECDRIVANVGYRPDREIYRELQVHECYATEGPIKLAASLLKQDSADCLNQVSCGAEALLNPEPNFFIVGSKSYGRSSNFLLSIGLQQIHELFTLIDDQKDLERLTDSLPSSGTVST